MKDSFVILVNLDSLPIEVSGCLINDQELFLEGVFLLLLFFFFLILLCPGHLWDLSSW